MKFLILVCQDAYAEPILNDLIAQGYRATKLASSGTFFKKGNTTLFMGIPSDKKEEVIQLIQSSCDKLDESFPGKRKKTGHSAHRVTLFVIDARASVPEC